MGVLVDDLLARSPDFAALWRQQTVLAREGGERAFLVPGRGLIRYEQSTLVVAAHPEVKLVCLAPVA